MPEAVAFPKNGEPGVSAPRKEFDVVETESNPFGFPVVGLRLGGVSPIATDPITSALCCIRYDTLASERATVSAWLAFKGFVDHSASGGTWVSKIA